MILILCSPSFYATFLLKGTPMKAVLQRVNSASVTIDSQEVAAIKNGLLVLLGIKKGDGEEEMKYLTKKILNLRIFNDENGNMNKSVMDNNLPVLLVSQFTLYGDCKKGNRPSFYEAMPPAEAQAMYNAFISYFKEQHSPVETGVFGAYMQVALINDGPVTIILEK